MPSKQAMACLLKVSPSGLSDQVPSKPPEAMAAIPRPPKTMLTTLARMPAIIQM